MLGGGRADVVAGREDHADQQGLTAVVCQANLIAVRIRQDVVADLFADSGLRDIERRVTIIRRGGVREGGCAEKCATKKEGEWNSPS